MIVEFGPYVLEKAQWRLRRAGEVVALPPKALALLVLLVDRAGQLVTKEEILQSLWHGTFVEEGNVAFYVAMLRKTLADPPGATYIETIKTRGYRFVMPVVVRAETPAPPPAPLLLPPAATEARAAEAATAVPPATRSSRPSSLRPGVIGAAVAIGLASMAWVAFGRVSDPPVRSIVVMPFDAIAPAADQAYLEAGMAEAITMRLGNLPDLRVPPLAAVRADEGPFEAGQRLGTDAVLTGSVQSSGARLLVSAQLLRVTNGSRIWSWTFDTTPGEILDVQNEIAERLAARLGRELTAAEHARVIRRDTSSGEAYDLFMQARQHWRLRSPHSVQQAIPLYERAIALDPGFARAYAGLADCYNLSMSGLPPAVRYPRAKANAEKALSLDPSSAEARTSLAFLRYKFEWNWREADAEFRRAIALDPRYALAHHWYGEFLSLMGHTDQGIASLQRALELEPQSLAIRVDLVAPLLKANRAAEARALMESGLAIDPTWPSLWTKMADIHAAEGRMAESAESTWRWLILRAVPMSEVDDLRKAFADGGRDGMLRAQIRQWKAQDIAPTSRASFGLASLISFNYGLLGDREETLRWIDIALQRREDAVLHLKMHPAYDGIRGDPRFVQVLERHGLAGDPIGS